MIDRILTTGIPTQQRTTINEGIPIKPIKEDPKLSSENQFDEKQSQQKDEKQKEKVEAIVKGLNAFLKPIHTSVKFKLHEKLNQYYVTLIDDSTNEVIREIPPKKFLDMYAAMAEHLGLLVDKKI